MYRLHKICRAFLPSSPMSSCFCSQPGSPAPLLSYPFTFDQFFIKLISYFWEFHINIILWCITFEFLPLTEIPLRFNHSVAYLFSLVSALHCMPKAVIAYHTPTEGCIVSFQFEKLWKELLYIKDCIWTWYSCSLQWITNRGTVISYWNAS